MQLDMDGWGRDTRAEPADGRMDTRGKSWEEECMARGGTEGATQRVRTDGRMDGRSNERWTRE